MRQTGLQVAFDSACNLDACNAWRKTMHSVTEFLLRKTSGLCMLRRLLELGFSRGQQSRLDFCGNTQLTG